MKKILILEDNPYTLAQLTKMAEEVAAEIQSYPCSTLAEAYAAALENTIDIFLVDVILDVNKPGDASGLDFVRRIREMKKYLFNPVIVITSLEDPRLYAYEQLHCYGYVEKPFHPERVKELITQCLAFPGAEEHRKMLHFRKEGIIYPIERETIAYAEGYKHGICIHTLDKNMLQVPYITIKHFVQIADSREFVQCSRGAVVNRKCVYSVDVANRYIILKNELGTVEIGITYRQKIKDLFADKDDRCD